MADLDFDKILGTPVVPTGDSDPIKSIYGIIPSYDNTQMHLKFQLMYFIEKYDLDEWRKVFEDIDHQLTVNKNVTFFSQQTLRSLLSAYTQNDLIRGIKVQTMNQTGGEK
jgi:hypothetical protein